MFVLQPSATVGAKFIIHVRAYNESHPGDNMPNLYRIFNRRVRAGVCIGKRIQLAGHNAGDG